MANNLIPEELQALIQQYLTDGVLTDKERQVILNKAEKMGLDRDEIDLYLDAEEQKIDQATDAAVRKQKGKICPYCGGSIPQLADKCPHCGENITAEASGELQEIFDNLEDALVNLKSAKDIHTSKAIVERFARKAKMYYGSNPKVQKLLEEIEVETINAEKKAKSLARKNTLVSILTYNKKLTAVMVVALLIAIVWGISSLLSGPDILKNPQTCIEAVKKAIDNGDIDKAASYCTAYMDKHGYSNKIATAYTMTCNAYFENNEYDKAISLVETNGPYNGDIERKLRNDIASKLINEGKFDEAEEYGEISNTFMWGNARFISFMYKYIDYMKSHGDSEQEIKLFINSKIRATDPNDRYNFGPQLYEYAGIKTSYKSFKNK